MKKFIFLILIVSFSAFAQNSFYTQELQKIPGLLGLGQYCEEARDCQSGFCSSEACTIPFYKVCDEPGRTCMPRESQCYFNSQCCSNLCSSSGVCVADGLHECVSNGSSYRFSSSECCSGMATAQGVCRASKNSCAYVGQSCLKHNDCCSKRCGSNQHCAP